MSEENKNKNQQPRINPKTGNDPKPIAYREQKYSNESIGDNKATQENLQKSFIHTDNPVDKPKK